MLIILKYNLFFKLIYIMADVSSVVGAMAPNFF